MAILELQDVHVSYRTRDRRGRRATVTAVDGVSLRIERGECLGLVGESGCGKSSLARVVAGLRTPDRGAVHLDGTPLGSRRTRDQLRRVQMVFQDPSTSLDPRMTVRQTLREVLSIAPALNEVAGERHEVELLEAVGLTPGVLDRRPRALSGGQRQRVSIARALAVQPQVLVADEAVAALDVSVQAGVLNLLVRLSAELDLTTLFISHDLSVVRHLCPRVAVMYLGRIVEIAPTERLFAAPQHPYTRALLAAAPRLGQPPDRTLLLPGEPPSARAVPGGCRFHPRCPLAEPSCRRDDPVLDERWTGHAVACPVTRHGEAGGGERTL